MGHYYGRGEASDTEEDSRVRLGRRTSHLSGRHTDHLSQSRLRISSVRAKRFRGIPQETVVDFRTPEDEAVSAIIAGDNGTGKSSVVDALEFALQGRVSGQASLEGERPSVISLGGHGQPVVEVMFSDGSTVTRRIEQDRTWKWVASGSPHPRFDFAPFVLRRKDILQFWDYAPDARQIAVADYFRRRLSRYSLNRADLKWLVPSIGEKVKASMERIGESITASFLEMSTASAYVQGIEVHSGRITPSSLEVVARLKNNQTADPVGLFSEANLDLLAFLIFLAVAKEAAERGQARLLVLDDVLQSVDAVFRARVSEYIVEEFHDWQLIFTVHDRLWREQLRDMLRRRGMSFVDREIIRWSVETGPVIIDASHGMEVLLQQAMNRGDLYGTCAHAGLLLERTCNALSYNLPISVTRRPADKYTLGDLWPGIRKSLKRTTIASTVAEVDRWLHLRNMLGAHYNEWAQSLSQYESQQFGEAVLKLFESVRCGSCYRWVEAGTSGGSRVSWSCRCLATTVGKIPQK